MVPTVKFWCRRGDVAINYPGLSTSRVAVYCKAVWMQWQWLNTGVRMDTQNIKKRSLIVVHLAPACVLVCSICINLNHVQVNVGVGMASAPKLPSSQAQLRQEIC